MQWGDTLAYLRKNYGVSGRQPTLLSTLPYIRTDKPEHHQSTHIYTANHKKARKLLATTALTLLTDLNNFCNTKKPSRHCNGLVYTGDNLSPSPSANCRPATFCHRCGRGLTDVREAFPLLQRFYGSQFKTKRLRVASSGMLRVTESFQRRLAENKICSRKRKLERIAISSSSKWGW